MGFYLLKSFLKRTCASSIQSHTFNDYRGKTIVVDANIYIYLFAGEDKLLQSFYDLCACFYTHTITPIFVFDGKYDKDKKDELLLRREKRKVSELQYKELLEKMKALKEGNDAINVVEQRRLEDTLSQLKKQCIKLGQDDFENIKSLIQAFGMTYIIAPYEADALCGYLCYCGIAQACLSEDTDLFVYGAPVILRNLNMRTLSFDVYSVCSILKKLNLTFLEFQMLCLLCDNDYYKTGFTMFDVYHKYCLFIKDKINIDKMVLHNRKMMKMFVVTKTSKNKKKNKSLTKKQRDIHHKKKRQKHCILSTMTTIETTMETTSTDIPTPTDNSVETGNVIDVETNSITSMNKEKNNGCHTMITYFISQQMKDMYEGYLHVYDKFNIFHFKNDIFEPYNTIDYSIKDVSIDNLMCIMKNVGFYYV